jgi:S1-C subfamily serine protease
VVKGAGKELTVVVHPGDRKQEIVEGKVLRTNQDLDLALLQLGETETPLAALEFGDTSKLFETMEIVAFGYPFGKSLAVESTSYPTVSVNVGKVTSLRRDAKRLLTGIQWMPWSIPATRAGRCWTMPAGWSASQPAASAGRA